MKKIAAVIVLAGFITTTALAQQPNPPRHITPTTIVYQSPTNNSQQQPLKRIQPLQNQDRAPINAQPVVLYPHLQSLYPVYVYSQKSYRPEDNEGVINDGHAPNMARNLKYMNTSEALPSNTGTSGR